MFFCGDGRKGVLNWSTRFLRILVISIITKQLFHLMILAIFKMIETK
jgi:hypothetical protein